MGVALSKNGSRVLRVFFAFVILFLYAPILILVVFSFNTSEVPSFPLTGFTLHWYREFLGNSDLRGALQTSAIIGSSRASGPCCSGCWHRSPSSAVASERKPRSPPSS